MLSRMSLLPAGAFLLAAVVPSRGAEPTPEQLAALPDKRILEVFQGSASSEVRARLFERIMEELAGGVRSVKPIVEQRIGQLEDDYFKLLKKELPRAYRVHLASLGDEEIHRIQYERRKWRSYIATTGHREKFQTEFFDTALDTAALVFPYLNEVLSPETATKRAELLEFSAYLAAVLKEIDLDTDPTAARKSPTGLPYPPLDRPRTPQENLAYLEKTMVMALTIAPPEAAKVLIGNARTAREIDYEEGEFVMYANIIRLFVGSVAWSVDPLTCACARDHSNDRKEGRASGHSSTVPGKTGFGDRCRLWGTQGRSEGAGGGNGKSYLRGLSYGGGHTGPLYSLTRNVVGIGMRQGAATSIYRTDNRLLHPCAVTEGESFMPPGLTRNDLSSPALSQVYNKIKAGKFADAYQAAGRVVEKDPVNRMILRFFQSAIQVELDWRAEGIAAISRTGDVYYGRKLLDEALKLFEGLPEHEGKLASSLDYPDEADSSRDEFEIGKKFHALVESAGSPKSPPGNDRTLARLRSFAERYPGSVYAKAAAHCLNDGKDPNPITSYFLDRNPGIQKYDYPAP